MGIRFYSESSWLFAMCIVAVLVALLFVWIGGMHIHRRASWPRERRRREGWARLVVDVESWTRVTDAGDFLVVLAVPNEPEGSRMYRDAATKTRWRATVRLTPAAIAHVEAENQLPVRRSGSKMVIDLAAIEGEAAEAIERTIFLERGVPHWKIVDDSDLGG